MSDTLRTTSEQYDRRIKEIDRQIKGHESTIETLKKERADVDQAKAGVDEIIAKQPKKKTEAPK